MKRRQPTDNNVFSHDRLSWFQGTFIATYPVFLATKCLDPPLVFLLFHGQSLNGEEVLNTNIGWFVNCYEQHKFPQSGKQEKVANNMPV